MQQRLALIPIALASLTLGIAPAATAEKPRLVCVGSLSQSTHLNGYCDPGQGIPTARFNGGVSPKKLDRRTREPVRFTLSGRYRWFAENPSPGLRELVIELDRNGGIEGADIAVCRRTQLTARGTAAARRICRASIVGVGSAHVLLPGSASESPALPLTLFYGGAHAGATTVFVHAFLGRPIVAVAKLTGVDRGRYGWKAVLRVPKALAGATIADFQLTTGRPAGLGGSGELARARCSDGHLQARVLSVLADGTRLYGTLLRSCTSKGPE